jgi:hypothetical protein
LGHLGLLWETFTFRYEKYLKVPVTALVSAVAGRRKIELPNVREYAWYKATVVFTRPQPQPERINGTSSDRTYEM